MNLNLLIDKTIPIFIAFLCIGITILDFLGALDSIPFIRERIPVMILLSVGLIGAHLIVERSIRKETEKKINSITAKINEAFDEKTLLTLVNKIWEEQKSVIESFLNEASQLKRLDALVKYVEEKFKEFDNGVPFEIKQMDPWDLTITIIDISKGTLIYHPNSEQVNKSKSQKQPYQRILKERTGSFVWFNNFMSEQFLAREFKTHKLNSDGRITKIFFEEVRKLGVIVVFESHINLLGSFRRIS